MVRASIVSTSIDPDLSVNFAKMDHEMCDGPALTSVVTLSGIRYQHAQPAPETDGAFRNLSSESAHPSERPPTQTLNVKRLNDGIRKVDAEHYS